MAQEDDFFIFHPDSKSTFIGLKAFKQLGERVWMKDSRVNFSSSSLVAWFSLFLDDDKDVSHANTQWSIVYGLHG
jgi:hypothetical protein